MHSFDGIYSTGGIMSRGGDSGFEAFGAGSRPDPDGGVPTGRAGASARAGSSGVVRSGHTPGKAPAGSVAGFRRSPGCFASAAAEVSSWGHSRASACRPAPARRRAGPSPSAGGRGPRPGSGGGVRPGRGPRPRAASISSRARNSRSAAWRARWRLASSSFAFVVVMVAPVAVIPPCSSLRPDRAGCASGAGRPHLYPGERRPHDGEAEPS